jgi:hypothetical protein
MPAAQQQTKWLMKNLLWNAEKKNLLRDEYK